MFIASFVLENKYLHCLAFIPLKPGKHSFYQSYCFKCIVNLPNKHLRSQLIEVTTFVRDESSPFTESDVQEGEALNFGVLQCTCVLYPPLTGFLGLSIPLKRKKVLPDKVFTTPPCQPTAYYQIWYKQGGKLLSFYRKENENYCPEL